MASHLSLSIIFLIFSRLSGAYRVSVKTGGSITIPCPYNLRYKTHVKYLCKVDYLHRCSPDVHSKSINKASISHYINKQTFTVTMTDLTTEDSGRYRCVVEINGGIDVIIKRFQLSVIPGTPELYVDQQEQTTDATRGNVLTVTMSGLKMENTGWYRCGVGDLMMPVHITVRQQTTTQSTTTMTTTQAPTTEQSSFSPTAEPVQTDNTVQGPEGGKEKDTMSSIDLNVLLIPLGMLVVVISGVLVTWKMWRKYKDNKAMDQTTNTSVDPFHADDDGDVTYSTVVPKRRNQLNLQTKGQPYDVVYSSLVLHPTEGRNTAVTD
ncbi:CMRF35-like molecule 8 isoform X2 [Oncorhynchus nerka]|uniref:CMRF35-like molecule 8 isoform X2 n=1 Tax=Oncorhynchus nerka TaxID=8023 RepID=UPI001130C5E9|nr:CMRF35-like molecule 8 isoform X2 [Oncorhynchus nerka]